MPAVTATKYLVTVGMRDVPHLNEKDREEILANFSPHEREARANGVPMLGSGAIYPISEADIICDPFEIPAWWPVAYAMDVGWNCTASLWGAWDRQNDIVYCYSEYKRGYAEPVVHAQAIRSRGVWIPGVIDPASRGRSQYDGTQLIQSYREYGLDITPADNAVEAGLLTVLKRMTTGRIKVFRTLGAWLEEFRLYRRDERGKVVKEGDHLMDCCRYLVMSGMARAITKPIDPEEDDAKWAYNQGRSAVGGY